MIRFLENWRQFLLLENVTIHETIEKLNETGLRAVFCVDIENHLKGVVSDGDLRRGLLRGLSMSSLILDILNTEPVTCPEGINLSVVNSLMEEKKLLQVPVIDKFGRMVGLYIREEFYQSQNPAHDHYMIIMAGGRGTRLLPHTESCPKPLLEVGGKPMMQHTIERAKRQGFCNFIISINYLGDMIKNYFGDGRKLGVNIQYISEKEPLGTAGALSLLEFKPDIPFVVTNGDVLTDLNYRELLEFLSRNSAVGAMTVRLHEWRNPFGVVLIDGVQIKGFTEKPVTKSYINAGVYALAPSALDNLIRGQHCDMPTLFDRIRKKNLNTVAFFVHEKWLDVGRPQDLQLANSEKDL